MNMSFDTAGVAKSVALNYVELSGYGSRVLKDARTTLRDSVIYLFIVKLV